MRLATKCFRLEFHSYCDKIVFNDILYHLFTIWHHKYTDLLKTNRSIPKLNQFPNFENLWYQSKHLGQTKEVHWYKEIPYEIRSNRIWYLQEPIFPMLPDKIGHIGWHYSAYSIESHTLLSLVSASETRFTENDEKDFLTPTISLHI